MHPCTGTEARNCASPCLEDAISETTVFDQKVYNKWLIYLKQISKQLANVGLNVKFGEFIKQS